ncbi:MAG: hypothetical protein ACMXYD_03260 [Candidatus Woesearchaeota archaeon]
MQVTRISLLLILLVIAASTTTALGITPPRATIDFSPELEGSFDVLVMNHRATSIGTSVTISGDLAGYFTAEAPDINSRGASKATVSYSLPEDVRPGENHVLITWTEEFFDEQTGIVSRTAVQARYTVWKPYPGRYAEITASAEHVGQGEDTRLRVQIASKGDQALRGDLRVRILDANNRLQDTIVLERIEIGANTDWQRYFQVRSNSFEPGRYQVLAEYDYQAGVASTETSLIIGEESAEAISVTPKQVYLDKELTRFDVRVESLWNEPLRGVAAEIVLGGNQARTPSVTLASFEQKTLTAYWETDRNLVEGEHQVVVRTYFVDEAYTENTFSVTVYNETPQPQTQQPSSSVVLGLTDILFLLLLLGLIGYVVIHVMGRHQ